MANSKDKAPGYRTAGFRLRSNRPTSYGSDIFAARRAAIKT